MAALAHWFGLSLPIGAFLAGMVVGESDFRHQVEDDLRPFRDVLLGLFFFTIGTQIDPLAAAERPAATLAALALFLGLKALVVLLVTLPTPWRGQAGLRSALVLAHGSEFGLLLLSLAARQEGLLPQSLAQPFLMGLVISLALAPLLIQHNGRLAALLWPGRDEGDGEAYERHASDASRSLDNHVILCGCGRVGRLVASVLESAGIPYLAIESEYGQLEHARRRGHRVIFGDASRSRMLDAAGLRRAGMVVITFDRWASVEKMLHHIRHTSPTIHVVVSARDDRDQDRFIAAGANAVLAENLAAGLSLGAHTLEAMGLPHEEVNRHIETLRATLHEAPLETLRY